MNTLTNKNIILDKENHQYSLVEEPELVFTSVTTFVHNFFEKFDSEKIAKKLVSTHPKYVDRSVESLIDEWEASGRHGTKVHDEIENWVKEGAIPGEAKAVVAIDWLKNYQKKSDIEVFSEVLIYSKELKIAGTIDLLALDKVTGIYEIIDWKTSKRINTTSFGNKTGNKFATRDVPDCNFYHYSLQLSLYRLILEEYYGFTVQNQLITHLQNDGAKAYIATYMRDHILEMLNN
ncbi:MAG: hypothetical protein CMG74_06610 [Candidatus Marinimicrobia bacterium]|nr:hypothetical protein [Candidatus Neomarinimicrobiota bacterium]